MTTTTATTSSVPQTFRSFGRTDLLRMTAILAILIVIAVGSFAFGRGTADTSDTRPVSITRVTTPPATFSDCVPVGHQPPC